MQHQHEAADLLEAQKVGGLSGIPCHHRSLFNFVGKGDALAKGTMLYSSSKERAGVDLLPQVEAVMCR